MLFFLILNLSYKIPEIGWISDSGMPFVFVEKDQKGVTLYFPLFTYCFFLNYSFVCDKWVTDVSFSFF